MLWNGSAFPRLPLHLARLTASAARLGWPAPVLGDALSGLPDTALSGQPSTPLPSTPLPSTPLPSTPLPSMPLRVRLTLNAKGQITVETAALPVSKPQWTVTLHPRRLASSDPWLAVKSTQRSLYDTARANLPPDLGEYLFANERGEVCEGSITSLFFDRGQGLRTPPLTCGLLPGVLRAELAAPEEILFLDDLPHVRLWLGNALRGLIPAVLA